MKQTFGKFAVPAGRACLPSEIENLLNYCMQDSDGGENVGKVIEKIKITSLLEPIKSMEVEAVVDTGATMVVLPQDIVDRLGLKKIREVKVKYANNRTESKTIYGVVTLEVKGRTGNFDVLAEAENSQPLIGQVVLEILDLVVDPRTRTLIPNPMSPEMPMVEILSAVLYFGR